MDEPTLKASEFCAAFHTRAAACITPLDTDDTLTRQWRENFRRHWDFIDLAIRKSCLLDRLIYGGETLRTEVCPVHKGHWSGCSPAPCPICRHGVCITGWIKNPGDPTSTNRAIRFLVGGTQCRRSELGGLPLPEAAAQQKLLSTWAVKTAMVLDSTNTRKHKLFYDRTERENLRPSDYATALRVRTRALHNFLSVLDKVSANRHTCNGLDSAKYRRAIIARRRVGRGTDIANYAVRRCAKLHRPYRDSVPAGYDRRSLPIGLQFIGRPWDEGLLFRLGYAAETIVQWKKPATYCDLPKDEEP